MTLSKQVDRRSVLKAAPAATALVALPVGSALAGIQPRSEFVELCRECVFAKRYVKRVGQRVDDCYQRAVDGLVKAHEQTTGRRLETMAEALMNNRELEPYFDNDDSRRMGNKLQFIGIKEPYNTQWKDAYGITAAENAESSAKERFEELFNQVLEIRASSLAECALKTTLVKMAGKGDEITESLIADFQAVGVMPDWGMPY